MLRINKHYVMDENNNPIAVQISLTDFKMIEETIENYGLSKLIDETKNDESLTLKDAKKYYKTLKNELDS